MSVISRDRSIEECDALMDAAVTARRSDDLDATATALQACIEHPCAPHELDVSGLKEELARVHHRQGRLDAAIETWEQAIAAGCPSAPHPRANIAELLVEAGRRDEADTRYERLRAECGEDVGCTTPPATRMPPTITTWPCAGSTPGSRSALESGDSERIVEQLMDMRNRSRQAAGRDVYEAQVVVDDDQGGSAGGEISVVRCRIDLRPGHVRKPTTNPLSTVSIDASLVSKLSALLCTAALMPLSSRPA